MKIKTRKLRNLEVSAVGFGAMGLSHGYGAIPTPAEAVKLIQAAFELGYTFFDTAESYGIGKNELLIGEALKPIRKEVVIATKFGGPEVIEGKIYPKRYTPKQIREHLEASLKRLQTDYVDLYYQHRVSDDDVEEVADTVGQLIKEGKILTWGQSQSTPDQIRRAHSITPLTAIQSEFSMMERQFESEVIPLCEELNIGFVPFSPLASGFLSGKISRGQSYPGDDVRASITRFKDENIGANQPLLDLLNDYAMRKNVTMAQVSLAWMMHKKNFIVPIPGTKSLDRLKENLGAVNVELTTEEYETIESELAKIQIHGNRTDKDIILHRMG